MTTLAPKNMLKRVTRISKNIRKQLWVIYCYEIIISSCIQNCTYFFLEHTTELKIIFLFFNVFASLKNSCYSRTLKDRCIRVFQQNKRAIQFYISLNFSITILYYLNVVLYCDFCTCVVNLLSFIVWFQLRKHALYILNTLFYTTGVQLFL